MSLFETQVKVFHRISVYGRICDVCTKRAMPPEEVDKRANPGFLADTWYPERWESINDRDLCEPCYKNFMSLLERMAAPKVVALKQDT